LDPFDNDDLLDEGFTDANGEFMLNGTTRELTPIDPILQIFHDCNDGNRPCQKKVTIQLPKDYIHRGSNGRWYELKELNMEVDFKDQERSCVH
ncbi:hypothetical protein AB6A40_010540, partial [Gnathostoma spinigerum]